ncbi:MAG TPA: circularly permuted type 2 ATP-grasp protein [Polyangiaceae bacterium]
MVVINPSLAPPTGPAASGGANPAPVQPYDEFWKSHEQPRDEQRQLLGYLEGKTPAEMRRLGALILRRIREQEVTFNILGSPEGSNRPWQLGPLPLVLSPEHFADLSRGLAQRAVLLNAVIADAYGEQRLLKQGILPPRLILGNPEYWRACHGWVPLGGHHLHLYATDIGRRPDGSFCVFSDRTSAPAGAGYALENRLVVGRTLHELFREYSTLKINGFFSTLRQTVERLAPAGASPPRVAMLTPGMHDESSFEHAYLSRYLGFELVEGRDLTVRDNVVYMKTLSGLRRVDVVLRRVYDAFCDPLELREDSILGVAGLVGAARAGQVGVANGLGSRLVESPAFKAYLPKIAQYFLGEDLILPSVETLWCGDGVSLARVLGSLDDWIIKPAFRERQGDLVLPAESAQPQREALVAQLKARPEEFVAERWPALSVAPVWEESRLGTQSVALRMFVSRDANGYTVLPGGLARLDSAPDGLFLSGASDRSTMDVWVPSPHPEPQQTLPAMPERVLELRRGGVRLPSRLLDDIYWLGRHSERCDNIARLVRAGLERSGFEASPDAPNALSGILGALQRLEIIPPAASQVASSGSPRAVEAVLLGVIFDRAQSNNLPAAISRVRALTQRVRSRLSRDAWEVFRRLGSQLEHASPPPGVQEGDVAIDLLTEILTNMAAVAGTSLDNMVHGHAWAFFDMGKRVERGVFTLMLLQTMLQRQATRTRMEALLDVCDSLLTYRTRYLSSLQPAPVVDLLLTDDTNPRSLLYQVNVLMDHIRSLPRANTALRSRAEQRVITLQSSLLTADVGRACAGDGSGLWELAESGVNLLWQFSDDLTNTYFSHAETSHAVAPPAWIDENLEAD